MQQRLKFLIPAGIVLAIIIGVVTFPLWRPIFVDDVVDEAFPDLSAEERDALREMPEEQRDILVAMADDSSEEAEETVRSMIAENDEMNDDMLDADADSEPTVLFSADFTGYDAVHTGSGTATIYELADGSRVLRFEDFRVTNGPDLHVILSKATPEGVTESVGDNYIDLGMLKGNVGNQNYEIPDDVDLDEYSSIVIYCMPFHVNFSLAAFGA